MHFWQACAKDVLEKPMTFWSKSWSISRINFFSEKRSKNIFIWSGFDNHNFFEQSKEFVSAESQQKIELQDFFENKLPNGVLPTRWKKFWLFRPKLFTNILENSWSKPKNIRESVFSRKRVSFDEVFIY